MLKKFLTIFILLLGSILLFANEDKFNWTIKNNEIILSVAENCYVYQLGLFVEAYDANNNIIELVEPKAKAYYDNMSGSVDVYSSSKHVWKSSNLEKISGAKIIYQGCVAPTQSSGGVCYMLKELNLGNVAIEEIIDRAGADISKLFADFEVISVREAEMSKDEFISFLNQEKDALVNKDFFSNKSFIVVMLIAFLGGLALNFTPCVLPMIPINLAIIGANNSENKKASFARGMIYGLGMMLSYGTIGLVVILGGAKFGTITSSSVFNLVIALLFLILSLSMLEIFTIDLSRYQTKIDIKKIKNTAFVLPLVMGVTSSLLAGACVAPVLISMLLFSGQLYNSGNYWGLTIPFCFGLGMAIIWPFAGLLISKLPKPGKWMIRVKQCFAIFILGFGIYYGYLAYTLLPRAFSSETEFKALKLSLEESKITGKPVLIDFWATWCKACLHMEHSVLKDKEVQKILERKYLFNKFQAQKFDDENTKQLLNYFDITGLPAFVILKPNKK